MDGHDGPVLYSYIFVNKFDNRGKTIVYARSCGYDFVLIRLMNRIINTKNEIWDRLVFYWSGRRFMYPKSKRGTIAFPVPNVPAKLITMSKPSSGKSAIVVSLSTSILRSLIVRALSFLSKLACRRPCAVSNSNRCSCISGLHYAYFKKAMCSIASNNGGNAIFSIRPKSVIAYRVVQTATFCWLICVREGRKDAMCLPSTGNINRLLTGI